MRYGSYRTIIDNLVDRGCTIKGDFNNYLYTMSSKCWMLFGNVNLDDKSNITLLQEKMSSVTRTNGGLSVTNTNFENLTFLSTIEMIENDPQKSEKTAKIIMTNNPNLTFLGLNAKRDRLYLTIRDNPKLCVTPFELENLFNGVSLDSDLDTKICFSNKTWSNWCELPKSGYLQDMPDGCIHLVGDLLIDNTFDFANSYKLYLVE
ncbi:hypothetical protein CRE_16691 [Caenorhabditis remanei]|uniref:Uncharacterized protein n=1 Tax=Caenorhabditis remanei TaxID=31234 RepID=E3MB40_CAERE|nr:hypothetical protein CRE_16691 [Caenorhabditis remanei]